MEAGATFGPTHPTTPTMITDRCPVRFDCCLLRRSFVAAVRIAALGVIAAFCNEAVDAAPPEASVASPGTRVITDLNLELIRVEPGTFTMGSVREEPERNKAEGPRMQVTLSREFWLGKTEVTQAQYVAVMGVNPSTFEADGKDRPVERVSWIDALAFCRTLTERERGAGRLGADLAYTLPTEAQWEYACRAGTTGAYAGEPDAMAWHSANSEGTTHPVGRKRPNAWGFFDMAGNVLEWCYDWYGDYPGGAVTDPTGPERGYYRMARGGSWRTAANLGRSAARSGGSAGRLDYTIGFRLCLDANR